MANKRRKVVSRKSLSGKQTLPKAIFVLRFTGWTNIDFFYLIFLHILTSCINIKNNFKKNKKYYFNLFQNKKYFKKYLLSHSLD